MAVGQRGPNGRTGLEDQGLGPQGEATIGEEEAKEGKRGRTLADARIEVPVLNQRRSGRVWREPAPRQILHNSSTISDLEEEIDWIQSTLVEILNREVRAVTICARSKRWRNEEIREKRRELVKEVRRKRGGRGGRDKVKAAKSALRAEIRRAKRTTWEKFLN